MGENLGRILIASDHGGFLAKEFCKNFLKKFGRQIVDFGTNSAEISVDYPDFAEILAQNLGENDLGILICGTGIGISIAANRHKNVRCALCHDATTAKLARAHNDANVLAFGGRMVANAVIADMLDAFFSTNFEGGRHEKRVAKLGNCDVC